MPLVKRTLYSAFVESFGINGFTVDLDQRIITVRMTRYTTSESGVPTASDFVYIIQDTVKQEHVKETVPKEIAKRDSSGAVVFDENGSPIPIKVEQEVSRVVDVETKEFTNMITTLTSGGTIYKEIQDVLYKSFVSGYLNGDTGYTVE